MKLAKGESFSSNFSMDFHLGFSMDALLKLMPRVAEKGSKRSFEKKTQDGIIWTLLFMLYFFLGVKSR